MNNVNGIYIEFCNIGQGFLVICQNVGIVQNRICIFLNIRDNLDSLALIYTAVNSVQKAFSQISPGSENCICFPTAMADTQQAIQ